MSPPGQLDIKDDQITLSGDWTLAHYALLKTRISRHAALPDRRTLEADISNIGALDTAGASLLVDLFGGDGLARVLSQSQALSKDRHDLLHAVLQARSIEQDTMLSSVSLASKVFGRVGKGVTRFFHQLRLLIGFAGQLIATLFWIAPRPARWRVTSFVVHLHQTGLNALPIVALLSFLVGAVVAFLGATILDDFGATIYTVNLVAFSFLREFGVMLAAILLAGRTASAYTAQLGSMKANEEIDAIRTLGLSPMELLVIPRVLAMVVSLPILTFVGILSGIVGGSLVCIFALDISLTQILNILEEKIRVIHFYVGMSKAPIFAFVIAIIGCLEGFKTSGSAQSVGEHTTSAVVQSIFMVILLDSIAAIFFMEMGW